MDGRRFIKVRVWSSRSGTYQFAHLCGLGTKLRSIAVPWPIRQQCHKRIVNARISGAAVSDSASFFSFSWGPMCWPKFMLIIWTAATIENLSNLQFRLAPTETMPAESIFVCVFQLGSFFLYLVFCHPLEESRASLLGDVPTSLCRVIVTGEIAKPCLVEFVASFVGVRPPVVSYLKEFGKKTDGVGLVVVCSLDFHFICIHSYAHCVIFWKETGWWLLPCRSHDSDEISLIPHEPRKM